MSAQDLLSQFEAIIAAKKTSEQVRNHQARSGETHYSKQIGSRLSQAMKARRWSQTRLADELDVTNNTLSRIIAGQERLNMNLCCRAMELMGYEPSLLLSEEPIPGGWTGITAIDEMLTDVYGDKSQSGVDALGKYVAKDYLCCSHHYADNSAFDLKYEKNRGDLFAKNSISLQQRVYDTAHHGRDLMGISYEIERKENLRTSMGTRCIRRAVSAVLIDEDCVFVQAENQRRMVDNGALYDTCSSANILYLKNSIMSISKGAGVRIQRKVWFQLSEGQNRAY
ncbi:MAG: helix-turn-helix transcriptional regulator [Candidatus Latescibacterota bacterium]|nr:helix-turn-helix transcriptional regulator [Candidatus Latescibacterota bacterium]